MCEQLHRGLCAAESAPQEAGGGSGQRRKESQVLTDQKENGEKWSGHRGRKNKDTQKRVKKTKTQNVE